VSPWNNLTPAHSNLNLPHIQAPPPYPANKRDDISLALGEAWSWVIAQGLLVHTERVTGDDWVLSRRARKFQDETDFARYADARRLRREALHPKIKDKVWVAFMRGDFDTAALLSMKAVEVAVREAADLPNNLIGVDLMRRAFDNKNGPLTDPDADGGEKQGCSDLFAGAIALFKNPQSHRDVNLDNPDEALEIIMLANHLLRIVDSRKAQKKAAYTEDS